MPCYTWKKTEAQLRNRPKIVRREDRTNSADLAVGARICALKMHLWRVVLVALWLTNLTSIHKELGLIPCPTQRVKDLVLV